MKYFSKFLIFFVLLAILAPYASVFAQSVEFNPNFLLSDSELQNVQSMTREDIQAFLDDHGGAIAKLTIEDASSTPRQVSDIIFRAAQMHRINPKYLLVKLQKEQSLVINSTPTQKQLDWATGYGVCDGCSLSDPAIQKFKGFGTQVDSAAAVMRWYFDNLPITPWIKRPNNTYTIDATSVTPLSLATGFLYTYTPHIEGNRNFWNLWQKWFNQVYPDGSLVKSPNDPTVYLVQNGKRRPFANMTSLVSRFDPKLILVAPDSELVRYELGTPIRLANYSVLQQGQAYYLVVDDAIRPFENLDTVHRLGYNPDEIIAVTNDDIAGYTIGRLITATAPSAIGALFRVKENKKLYYVDEGVYHPILDEHIATINFPQLKPTEVSAASFGSYTAGDATLFKDGTLFGIRGTQKIYVVEHGRKRHIATDEIFTGLAYSRNNVIWTDEFTALAHPTGDSVYLREEVTRQSSDRSKEEETVVANTKMIKTPLEKTKIEGPQFDTPVNTYVVTDATGKILAGKNIDDVRPMASFAKVMTGYRLLTEGVKTWGTTAYNPKEHAVSYNYYRLASGERVKNSDLLLAMLVSSLDTPTRMLVKGVDPKEKGFLARMNGQAKTWGLKKTTFADPAGEELGTKTTAREFLTIFQKTVNNIDLRTYLGTASYSYTEVVDLDGKPGHYDTNTNHLMEKTGLPFTILASKTGYLDEAGAGLAMLIERPSDKKRFFVITMGNPDYTHRFNEPERLARWTITKF